MMKIEIMNTVYSRVVTGKVKDLVPCLSYEAVYYQQGIARKERKTYRKSIIDNTGVFPTGLIPKVRFFCKKQGINLEVVDKQVKVPSKDYVPVDGLTLRDYQESAVKRALLFKRGIIHVPTGGGKTHIGMGLASHFTRDNEGVLFIVHTKTILKQTIKAAKLILPDSKIGVIGDSENTPNLFTVGMVQTLHRLDLTNYGKKVGLIIVDEAHHLSTVGGTYVKVLEQIECPYRVGLTATLPYKDEAKLISEGYLGNVIAEVPVDELVDSGILATPKIKIVPIPMSHEVMAIRDYQTAYRVGVVERDDRNIIIAKSALDVVKSGKTALILVNLVDHGHNLLEILRDLDPKVRSEYVHGNTDNETRGRVKDMLETGEVQIAIATAVWKEGTDIPSLGAVVNAGGGKSEIMTLQAIGRGLRTVNGKTDVIIIDFFDTSSRYLVNHFGTRISTYCQMGWL